VRFIILAFLLLFANITYPTTSGAQESGIDSCISDAAYKYNIAPEIIKAIIKRESNGNPLAINISGKSHYPESRDKALKIIRENKSESFDVGIMQINKWWFDRFGYDYSYGFDACFNIQLGSWILAYEISRHGYNWEAIGHYHSHTEEHRRKYIKEITGLLAGETKQ